MRLVLERRSEERAEYRLEALPLAHQGLWCASALDESVGRDWARLVDLIDRVLQLGWCSGSVEVRQWGG